MVQAKVNRELASWGAALTSTNMSDGYIIYSKPKASSAMHEVEESNVLPPETITNDDNEEALAGAATTLSLLSPPTDSSATQNLSQSSVKMKCYYHHTHHYFLEYINNPIPDDAVIYAGEIPFQYNKVEGRYTEFVDNPIGSVL